MAQTRIDLLQFSEQLAFSKLLCRFHTMGLRSRPLWNRRPPELTHVEPADRALLHSDMGVASGLAPNPWDKLDPIAASGMTPNPLDKLDPIVAATEEDADNDFSFVSMLQDGGSQQVDNVETVEPFDLNMEDFDLGGLETPSDAYSPELGSSESRMRLRLTTNVQALVRSPWSNGQNLLNVFQW